MIDHVSIGVRDLDRSTHLYTEMLAPLGHKVLMSRPTTVGFGKDYPALWLNARPNLTIVADSGHHVCLRARSTEIVDAVYQAALAHGARGDGAPGVRPEYHPTYYAAFVRDFDENLFEVVTFISAK